ncbi:MAG: hypothetical protein HYT40_03940 [Candidatus Sungbacteria bacterium]|uniref:Uncharacterized protein n=1 Tax=Candidatus Sungiibacteriota bacterium TaxID=2750080 RepID=A0A931SC98_9BACT|nr:hypothetical protein [Candidatus Sungbacteria bacterium]
MAARRDNRRGAALPRPHQLQIGTFYSRSVWFDEERARIIFAEAGERYRKGVGYNFGLQQIQPQHVYTPPSLIAIGGRDLANWFFFLSLSQRGGLNSDDSIRLTRAVWDRRPDLFDPKHVALLHAAEIRRAIIGVAVEFYPQLNGETRAGSLSYKLKEFARHWRLNAMALDQYWGGDIRNLFAESRTFEEYFLLIDRGSQKKPEDKRIGFYGMRRKIFSLLAFWLIEFQLVRRFRTPLVVDFHVLRVLLQLRILGVTWRRLGPGDPKIMARRRPRALWKYPAVHIHEGLVNQVIAWSYEFLIRHELDPFDVHNGLWNLSRTLCASYYGNKSRTVRRFDPAAKKWHAVTARLVKVSQLHNVSAWPQSYRDLCRYCPFEEYCGLAIPAGPYYDWGEGVNAGPHVVFPGRQPALDGVQWYDLPLGVTRRQNNTVWNGRDRWSSPKTSTEGRPAKQLILIRVRRRRLVR